MAEFLSADLKTTLEWIVDYLRKSSVDAPIDEKIADELSKHHVELGYDSEIKLREDLSDKPTHTLLTIVLTLNANA